MRQRVAFWKVGVAAVKRLLFARLIPLCRIDWEIHSTQFWL